ncbi:cyclin-H [Ditylenchus destructor]|nr:cyclin-H [Ditylenchus destructor]
MYTSSTQKKCWTFCDQKELSLLRTKANQNYRDKYCQFLVSDDKEEHLLTPSEEIMLCKIFGCTGIRFGDEFLPTMWPSVQWTALAYFKRFYLQHSVMEYSPRNVMLTCYYLACKVDEFNVTIDQFVDNMSGDRESNIKTISSLEPVLMQEMGYQLTVHCPFRPFEGHIIDMKTKCSLDLDIVRPYSTEFFKKALIGDILLRYPPSQIALAAIKYGLEQIEQTSFVFDNYLTKLLEYNMPMTHTDEKLTLEKFQLRIDEICNTVIEQAQPVDPNQTSELQSKMQLMIVLHSKLLQRSQELENVDGECSNS